MKHLVEIWRRSSPGHADHDRAGPEHAGLDLEQALATGADGVDSTSTVSLELCLQRVRLSLESGRPISTSDLEAAARELWGALREAGKPAAAVDETTSRSDSGVILLQSSDEHAAVRDSSRRSDPGPRRRRVALATIAIVLAASLGLTFLRIPSGPAGPKLVPVPSPGVVGEVRCFRGHGSTVTAVAVCARNERVVSGAADGSLIVWNVATARKLLELGNVEAAITCLAVSPDQKLLFSGDADDGLQLWQLEGNTIIQEFRVVGAGGVRAIEFAQDAKKALSRHGDGSLCVWDLDHLRMIGRYLAGVPRQRIPWSFQDERPTLAKTGFAKTGFASTSLARTVDQRLTCVLPDGKASSGFEIWDAASQRLLCHFGGHTAHVTCADFAPDNRYVVTGSGDHTVRLWLLPAVPRAPAIETLAMPKASMSRNPN